MGHIVGGESRQQLGFCLWGDGKPLEDLSGDGEVGNQVRLMFKKAFVAAM